MCGIAGYTGNFPNKINLAKALMCLNSSRGNHSAGVASKITENHSSIFKRAINPIAFAKKIPKYLEANPHSMTVILHTRWATHGTINKQNAHPFKIDKVIGTHNGVMSNMKDMQEYLKYDKYEVDSQYLIHSLAKHSHLGIAYGSMNLAYFVEGDEHLLHLIRYNNPLAIAYVNNDKGLVYSSDEDHLTEALKWCKLDFELYNIKENCELHFYKNENGEIGLWDRDVQFDEKRSSFAPRTMGFHVNYYDAEYESKMISQGWCY